MHSLQQLISGDLNGARQIKLSCGLKELPRELFSLTESLEVMDLSRNLLSTLPEDFDRFKKLRILFLSENLFTELPTVLHNCKQLSMIGFKSNQITHFPENALPETTRWLILTNNRITRLPKSIGNCLRLQKVGLAGNLLTGLPEEMRQCRNLELLRVSANNFSALPEWLLDLPKLSWLAFAGNPFSHIVHNEVMLDEIDWSEFEILEQLGEGASGNIYKASLKKSARPETIAIKVFKGEVTSDGFPEDEMETSIAAGQHPNLVSLRGKIKNHPEQKQGLLMTLIPPSFYNLGLPPSLETCSRDTFPEGTIFTSGQILKIAIAVSSFAKHLHELGINHGDLYAHNTLVDKKGNTLVGDFGAASFYSIKDPNAKKIQQIECRAFGCLLDDLLTRLSPEEPINDMTRKLMQLREDLMREDPESRPLFLESLRRLNDMEADS